MIHIVIIHVVWKRMEQTKETHYTLNSCRIPQPRHLQRNCHSTASEDWEDFTGTCVCVSILFYLSVYLLVLSVSYHVLMHSANILSLINSLFSAH